MLAATLTAIVFLSAAGVASGRPMPRHWHAPAWWLRQALCIHAHESGDWHVHDEPYANGFQFTLSTWLSVGGSASTWVTATPREQLYRAWLNWLANGHRWGDGQWPTSSRECGLR